MPPLRFGFHHALMPCSASHAVIVALLDVSMMKFAAIPMWKRGKAMGKVATDIPAREKRGR